MAGKKRGGDQYLRARSGFVTADRTIVKAGQIVAADDAIVKGRERLFEPASDYVEAATRAPGERRLTGRRPSAVVLSATSGGKRTATRTTTPPAPEDQTPGDGPAEDDSTGGEPPSDNADNAE